MPRSGFDISQARILVTNDDGIHAPGLAVLQRVARSLSRDVWVVAPEAEQSGSAHSLTLRRPLRERRLSPRRFAIDGTPTDCVLLAVNHIIPKRRPDLILSGINRGSNLGEDVTYSGTIAAAMEGALLGVPSIALSQVRRGDGPTPWRIAEEHAGEVIRRLAGLDWPQGVLMNVNFPDPGHGPVTGVRVGRQGRRVGGIAILDGRDPKNRPYVWIGDFTSDETTTPGTDLEAIYNHAISVTPLHLDLTHDRSLDHLRKAFS